MMSCNSLMTIHTCANGELENLSVANDRLDTFLRSRMAANYPKAWSVCELALLLSHGQASVERGFSVNKELVVENQSEQTAARRIIKDHIIHVNGVTNVEITRNMVLAAGSAEVVTGALPLQGCGSGTLCRLNCNNVALSDNLNGV